MDNAEQNRPVRDVITDMELALRNGREAVEHFKELLDSLPVTPTESGPAIRKSDNGDSLYIIGRRCEGELREQIAHRIGPDEDAVIISAEVVHAYFATAGTLNDPRFSERRFSTGARQSKELPVETDRHAPCAQLLGNAPRRVLAPDPDR